MLVRGLLGQMMGRPGDMSYVGLQVVMLSYHMSVVENCTELSC